MGFLSSLSCLRIAKSISFRSCYCSRVYAVMKRVFLPALLGLAVLTGACSCALAQTFNLGVSDPGLGLGSVRVGPGGVSGTFTDPGLGSVRVGPGGISGRVPGIGSVGIGSGGVSGRFYVPGLPGFSAGCCTGHSGRGGAQKRGTDTTWQDVNPVAAPNNVQVPLGRTMYTGKQGATDINGPLLDKAVTNLQAPLSGMYGTIPSGQYGFGFPQSGTDTYHGPYNSSNSSGGPLPQTATSSVNLDIVDLKAMPLAGNGGYSNGNSGSWTGFPNADGGGDGGPPAPPVPQDCNGCYPVVNTHNGQIMGYKNPNESWTQFFSGQTGHLPQEWAQEGQICLQQMIDAGMNPDDPNGFF